MTKLGVLILLLASATWGQMPCAGGVLSKNDAIAFQQKKAIQVTPLKCGKYQHVEQVGGWSTCGQNACWSEPYDSCVDDMHMVTEREWQELQTRLKALEKKEK